MFTKEDYIFITVLSFIMAAIYTLGFMWIGDMTMALALFGCTAILGSILIDHFDNGEYFY